MCNPQQLLQASIVSLRTSQPLTRNQHTSNAQTIIFQVGQRILLLTRVQLLAIRTATDEPELSLG